MNKKKVLLTLFLLIATLALFFRFSYLTMDPFNYEEYGTSWDNEGYFANNARDKVLFGDWGVNDDDLNDPIYHTPTYTYITFLSFRLFGVNTLSLRIFPAMLGLISIFFASYLLYKKNKEEGLIYFLFLIINVTLIAFSRIAMVEYVSLFFLLIIIGLIINDKPFSWILVGFFLPFLFFTKITNSFFIASVPLSLLIYYYLEKDNDYLKRLVKLTYGGLVSIIVWSFWFFPRINEWLFTNFTGFENRIFLDPIKITKIIFFGLKIFIKDPLIMSLVFIYLLFICVKTIKKQKVSFLDILCLLTLILFLFQIIIVDHPLRRYMLLLPLFLLIAVKVISKIGDLNFNFNEKIYNVNRLRIISLIVFISIVINITQLTWAFSELTRDYESMHTFVTASKEIDSIIPAGAGVYGTFASALSTDNKIKPYFSYPYINYANTEDHLLQLLKQGKIEYAILTFDLMDQFEVKRNKIDFVLLPAHAYIRDNFKIIAVLNGKDHYTGSKDRKFYIYKLSKPKIYN